MNESPEHVISNDMINLIIAIIPWIIPDSTLLTKLLISVVLGFIVIVSRRKPKFITNYYKPVYYFLLILSPITMGVLAWITVVFFTAESFENLFWISFNRGLALGGILGVPLTLFGAHFGKNSNIKPLAKNTLNIGIAFISSLFQFTLPLILSWIGASTFTETSNKPLSSTVTGIFGIGWSLQSFIYDNHLGNPGSISGSGIFSLMGEIGIYLSTVVLYLFVNFLINTGFIILGVALEKLRVRFQK